MSRQREKLIDHYTKCLAYMVSDVDFQRWFGGDVASKIIKYSDLEHVQDIDELLPAKKDFIIILTENKKNEGHWCCLLKYDGLLEWFDPYGGVSGKPDGELSFISKAMKIVLHEDKHYLTRLLKESGKKVIWNKEEFQSLSDGVNTCGKWTIARIVMLNCGYTLKEFQDKIKQKMEETGKPPDIIMCDWIK